jgi:hypothetical protein
MNLASWVVFGYGSRLRTRRNLIDLSVHRHGDDKISLQIIEARGGIEVTASFSG